MRKILIGAIAGASVLAGSALSASAATKATKTRHFSEHVVGVRLSMAGSRYEDVYRVKTSPDGGGAMIQDASLNGTTFPVSGHDTTIRFFRDGAQTTKDSFTLTPPSTDGTGTITGRGTCTGGSGVHSTENCSYSFKGTYDLRTAVTVITFTGTDTRPVVRTPARAR